jgi:hypothetical protein
LTALNDAFICACRFEHEAVASLLLEQTIALEPELGRSIADTTDRQSFIKIPSENPCEPDSLTWIAC